MTKILIVDDSAVLREELKNFLTKNGHEVIEGKDGFDGFAKAKETDSIQLIISDVNMPEMDGLSMVKKIRTETQYKNIPIFMLTTESSADMKAVGKELKVTVWIVKPYNEEKVLFAINKVCGA